MDESTAKEGWRMRSLFALAGALLMIAGIASGEEATLQIHTDRTGIKISPTLYGIFFEEINHAGDGGLYAELIQNRSFEDSAAAPAAWSAVQSGEMRGSLKLDESRPLNPRNRRSLQVEATGRNGRFGAANGGYWGIALRRGETYLLSFYARGSAEMRSPLTVSLESASGKVYAQKRIRGLTEEWKQFRAALRAPSEDASARLVIATDAPGTFWLDVVSLFPQNTWKRRPNGLRADLMQLLYDLKPAFVRFPGGCFVEGDKLANAFRWKTTIGDISERVPHWNLWGYWSTNGLGLHEYLQMCEDLGAEPMYVINCGMSHSDHVPMESMQEWIQDALDVVEYANGPVTSRWGALRAKNGHPEPFHLKYLEIGNENGGPIYEERYALFYRALKERYPQIQLISNVPLPNQPVEIRDDHYYNSPEWFLVNSGLYDQAERRGPKIYVGEFAVTVHCGQGNLRAALAEAAFMIGLERNSDIVTMASYAPLFVNVNDRKWNPDAICFDSARSYGTPSYHVQKLFSLNRPDVTVPVMLTSTPRAEKPVGGAIGLATWETQAEYREVRVTRDGETLYADDFAQGAPGWRVYRGEWKAQDGSYRQTGTGGDLRAVAGDPRWSDYTIQLKARKISGAEGFLIMFRVRDDGNWYWWNLGGWGNVRHAIEKSVNGGKFIVGAPVPGRIETDRWYDIRIELRGRRIQCYLDGRLIHDVEDTGIQTMTAIAGRDTRTGELVVKVVNAEDAPRTTVIHLEGTESYASEARAIVLTSNHPDDENSFSQPFKVAPVTTTLRGVRRRFTHTFPPHSLTILRLKPRK